jgi:Glycosyltransferase family 87
MMRRLFGALLLAILGIALVWRGLVPALSKVDTDFPNYLTAARIVADSGPVERLYDDSWFQSQMRRYQIGNPAEGKFAPFPPPTALLLVPLAHLAPLAALRVVTALSMLCLIGAIFLLARVLSWSYLQAAVLVLLSGYANFNALRFGQPYMLVALSCVLGYYARQRGAPFWAGLCLGLFVPIKYFPIVLLIYFAARREWKLVFGGAVAASAVVALSIAVLGWPVHELFLRSVLGTHLTGRLSMQSPFSASFQSFDALYRRLFVPDPALNPQPWLAWPRFEPVALIVTKSVLFATAIVTLLRGARGGVIDSVAFSVGMLGILTLLLAPATATYHFVLLWLPVGLVVNAFYREGKPVWAGLMLGSYALIGFMPYGHALRFEGRGGLSVLSFPRLFVLLAMFWLCVGFAWRRRADQIPVN